MAESAIGRRGSWRLRLTLVLAGWGAVIAGSSCQRSGADGGGGGAIAGGGGGAEDAGTPTGGTAGGGWAGGAANGGGGTTGAGGRSCPAAITASNVPPDVLILFDRSGSMNEDLTGMACAGGCGATSKWSIATAALANVLAMTEGTVNWGLKLFASTGNACVVSNVAEIAPQPMTAGAISALLAQTVPGSSTPTTAALSNAANYLRTFTDPNPKFILLVTDGTPTCGMSVCAPGSDLSANTCDDANAVAMVKTVHDMGFPVFVLGIGTWNAVGDETLSQMAVKGGYPRNASPAYYPVDSGDSLAATIRTITAVLDPCYLGVRPAPQAGADIASVTGDGTPIPNDPTNGWSFAAMASGSGILLNGAACDSYKAGSIRTIMVDLVCR